MTSDDFSFSRAVHLIDSIKSIRFAIDDDSAIRRSSRTADDAFLRARARARDTRSESFARISAAGSSKRTVTGRC